ncbi:MAG: dihydroorotate dehydrogenase [Christensenellaceae bacterium]|nr:dihydroorotate dehydrogenase [Christensenellaceae bacterium]
MVDFDTSVSLSGLELDNPVIPASGTFGYGYEYAEWYDINCLGSIAIKGTTMEARFGNPTPRIAEAEGGLLNSVGLQNPGVWNVINEELPKLKEVYSKKVIANVCGFSVAEYKRCAELLSLEEQVGIIEVNISCPNVHEGGMSFGVSCSGAAEVTEAVKSAARKPVYVKLSPNVTNIVSIAKACEDAGADGLSLINTIMGMRIDLKTKRPVLANKKGGLSGRAVLPVALRMVYDVYEAVDIPVIGMGGISSADDVIEMMLAGASAVQVGSENLIDPYACKRIIAELPKTMRKYGISDLKSIIGGAHDNG